VAVTHHGLRCTHPLELKRPPAGLAGWLVLADAPQILAKSRPSGSAGSDPSRRRLEHDLEVRENAAVCCAGVRRIGRQNLWKIPPAVRCVERQARCQGPSYNVTPRE